MKGKKLELNQQTLKNLTAGENELRGEHQQQYAATFPPVCEHTNFITCTHC